MDERSVELRVRAVRIEGGEPTAVLEDPETGRRLEIPIGPFEASAVILELEGIVPPRPLTHDLLAQVFKEAGFRLESAELYGDGGARARLTYSRGSARAEKEVRPSDALALALRLGAPITARSSLLGAAAGRAPLFWRRRARVFALGGRKASSQ
jgi:bifunctional DNase/RNase